jgi:hypothetical protein
MASSRTCAGLSSILTMLTVVSSSGQEAPSVYHTARAVVQTGQHGGIVLALDKPSREGGLGPVISLQEQSNAVASLPSLSGAAESMLARHVVDGRTVDEAHHVLVDARAGTCLSMLRAPVRDSVEGTLFQVVVGAFNMSTGQRIPRSGWLGLGGGGGSITQECAHRRISIPAGGTLRTVLDKAVRESPGAMWLAVQDTTGQCGLGILMRGVAGEPLLLQIGVVSGSEVPE